MKSLTKSIGLIILLATSVSCEKLIYFNTEMEFSSSPLALVHAACGTGNCEGETLDAVKFGFEILDGIEVDIQQSGNGTLWLSHDSKVYSGNGDEGGYFSFTSDNTIEKTISGDSSFYYTRLEEVFEYMKKASIKKHISLDVKRPFELFTSNDYEDMAEQIIELTERYNLKDQILIESSSPVFLSRFNGNKMGIETYYLCMGDFDKGIATAKSNNLTGISFKFESMDSINQSLIDLLHSTGLKMQIFYVNQPEDIEKLYGYGIDFLQTDNLDFYNYNTGV